MSDLGEEEKLTEGCSGNNYWPFVSPGKSGEDRNGSRVLLIRTSHTLKNVGVSTGRDREKNAEIRSRDLYYHVDICGKKLDPNRNAGDRKPKVNDQGGAKPMMGTQTWYVDISLEDFLIGRNTVVLCFLCATRHLNSIV